jgi:hypothetical protein
MDIDTIQSLQYLDKNIYDQVKKSADLKWGNKDTYPKLKWVYRQYLKNKGKVKLSPTQVKNPGYQKIAPYPTVNVNFGPLNSDFKKKGYI